MKTIFPFPFFYSNVQQRCCKLCALRLDSTSSSLFAGGLLGWRLALSSTCMPWHKAFEFARPDIFLMLFLCTTRRTSGVWVTNNQAAGTGLRSIIMCEKLWSCPVSLWTRMSQANAGQAVARHLAVRFSSPKSPQSEASDHVRTCIAAVGQFQKPFRYNAFFGYFVSMGKLDQIWPLLKMPNWLIVN